LELLLHVFLQHCFLSNNKQFGISGKNAESVHTKGTMPHPQSAFNECELIPPNSVSVRITESFPYCLYASTEQSIISV
jgi:hypothetical protein